MMLNRWIALGNLAAVVMCLAAAPVAHAQAWPVAEQPDLAAQLQKAPTLQLEALGHPAVSVQPCGTALAPNADGKTYSVLQYYQKQYYLDLRVYIIDLSTGQVKLQHLPDAEHVRREVAERAFTWNGTMGEDHRLYGAVPNQRKHHTGGSVSVYTYDPVAREVQLFTEVPGVGGERTPFALGPDGRLYGAGTYMAEGDMTHPTVYWVDPRTKEHHLYGRVGPGHGSNVGFGYFAGVDDTHIYVASGKIPWYLVAVNIQTGAQEVLLEAEEGDFPNRMIIRARYPGAEAMVQKNDQAPKKEYWLHRGRAIARTEGPPPWEPRQSPQEKLPPRPEIYSGGTSSRSAGQLDPGPDGQATLWYRESKQDQWKSISLGQVQRHPLPVRWLAPLPDGRLYGSATAYQGRFLYDPARGQTTPLGRGISVYTMLAHNGKIYESGYPSAPIVEYDPNQPWTAGIAGPPGEPGPEFTSPQSNPRQVAHLMEKTRVKKVMSSVVGADGRIYFAGMGLRDYNGGGLGWYDPATGKEGGLWQPFSRHGIWWLTPALEARYLVASTRADEETREQARLFVYDVEKGEVVRSFVPVAGADKSGPLLEVAPGRMIGITEAPDNDKEGILYGVDIRSGEVLFNRRLPTAYRLNWWQTSAHSANFVKGPDGFIWTMLDDVLVRIDPKTTAVHVVGRVEKGPCQFVFQGNDLYLAGDEHLRRVRDIVRTP